MTDLLLCYFYYTDSVGNTDLTSSRMFFLLQKDVCLPILAVCDLVLINSSIIKTVLHNLDFFDSDYYRSLIKDAESNVQLLTG